MTEGQKLIIERIHNQIKDAMVKKARLTIAIREAILTGVQPDITQMEELRQIDLFIKDCYRAQINDIKKFAKKIKTSDMVNDLVRSEVAQRLYHENVMIHKDELALYETLLSELRHIEDEQGALYFYMNKANNRRVTNTELERILRLNIKNMEAIIPSLQGTLSSEIDTLGSAIAHITEKRTALEEDIAAREQRAGGQRTKKTIKEKKEVDILNRAINDLQGRKNTHETIYSASLKSEDQRNREASQRRKELIDKYREQQEALKVIRAQDNERRHQANEAARAAAMPPASTPPTPVVGRRPAKNKRSLKEKLTKVIAVVLAATMAITGAISSFIAKKSNYQPPATRPAIEETFVRETNPSDIEEETLENNIVETIFDQDLKPEQEVVTETRTVGLGDTVTIGKDIYSSINDAIKGENALNARFGPSQEYTVVEVTFSDGTNTHTILANDPEYKEKQNAYSSAGLKCVSCGLSATLSPEQAALADSNTIIANMTGRCQGDQVNLVGANVMSTGRGM